MRILIVGQPSNNRGDEAAAKGLIYGIKSRLPKARFDIVYGAEGREPVIPDGEYISNFHRSFLLRFGKILWLKHFFYLILYKLGVEHNSLSAEACLGRLISGCDAALYAPAGPYITDFRGTIRPLFFIALIKLYGRKLMIYAPSMGPFTNSGRLSIRNWLFVTFRRLILERVDAITVRDGRSFEYVKELGLSKGKVLLASDSALQNPIDEESGKELCRLISIDPAHEFLVGITPIELSWHRYWSRYEGINSRIAMIAAKAMDYCVSRYGAKVIFFPQLFGKEGKLHTTDLPEIFNVIHLMANKHATQIVDPYLPTEQQQVLMKFMRLFVGFRHHSAVLSVKMQIPCICISYEHKAISFMEDVGLERLVIDLADLTYDRLIALLDETIESRTEIVSHLANISKEIKRKASISSEAFCRMVSSEPRL